MHLIPRNYAYRTCSYGDFQEWFIVTIRERLGKRGGSNGNPPMFNMIKECGYLVLVKFELGAVEYFLIFGQYAGIKGKDQFTGRNHADYFSARAERCQQPCYENIGVEYNIHRVEARFLRTAWISASISSIVIPFVPWSAERR